MVAFDNMQDRPIKGTTDWQRYEVVLDVRRIRLAYHLGFYLTVQGRFG
jgi:AraC family transcriptional regulator